ncbi:MAG: 60S ribosomal export protein NMD3 [Candidatus Hadarchaeum sp.]|uniref:60S ribosomal export protein NMD3 n=1 Tax=Candidatus Hadarchaeum sp. TaxID=2883567 RepID=UPI003171939D
MRRFCYKCGAFEDDAGPLLQGLCQRCFSDLPLMEVPAEIEVVLCRDCGAIKIGGRWQSQFSGEPVKEAARQALLHSVRVLSYTDSEKRLLRAAEAPGLRFEVEPRLEESLVVVRASGKLHPLQKIPKIEEHALKLDLKYTTCDVCRLKRAKHHEAILQLRDFSSTEKRLQIQREVEKIVAQLGKSEPRNFIANFKEQHGGLDYYLSSVNLGRKIAALLKERFGATVIESAKLIGRTRDGRKKYRVSILARFM